jgi:hypothetical protein
MVGTVPRPRSWHHGAMVDAGDEHVARVMWRHLEPIHTLTYFAPESTEAFTAAGLKGFWMGYFAGRAAPMGPVGPAVVGATFFNFAPARVHRALPDAWERATPARVLDARLEGVDVALRGVLGDMADSSAVRRAAELLRIASEGAVTDGRPLAAANAALEWPTEPHLTVWHATTVLREHRGDGHVAALVEAGLDGRRALVMMTAIDAVPRALLQTSRGWEDDQWAEAVDALVARGWVAPDGSATATGRAARGAIEATTDRLAAGPWERLGEARTAELRATLAPMVDAVVATGTMPVPNPIGLTPPRTAG